MNVVVEIEGREAIPVRAIPFLTDWEVLSPDVLAQALTGDVEFTPQFKNLRAFRFDGGITKAVNPNWWANFPVRKLKALSDRIKHSEITHETGYSEWQRASLPVLPAGVFVWRDEFEDCFWRRFGPDGEAMLELNAAGEPKRPRRNESVQLDFDPFIQDEDFRSLVMEGVPTEPAATSSPAPAVSGKRCEKAMADSPQPIEKEVARASGHSTKTRRNALTPVIELAQTKCRNPTDSAEVWAAMLVLAETKSHPLIGATEDGLQYLKDGAAATLTRDALSKRLSPGRRR